MSLLPSDSLTSDFRWRWVALFVALALTAAACGGSDAPAADGDNADDAGAGADDSDTDTDTDSDADADSDSDGAGDNSDGAGDGDTTTDDTVETAESDPVGVEIPATDETPGAATAAPLDLRAVDGRGVDVSLDAVPERVVAVSDGVEAETLIALGLDPILMGQAESGRSAPWVDDFAGIETFDLGALSVETIEAARPELIVTSSSDADLHTMLESVAPLYVVDVTRPWRDELRSLAQLVGRPNDAELVIVSHRVSIEQARLALGGWVGSTLLVASVTPADELVAFTDASSISLLLNELGFDPLVGSFDGSATQAYNLQRAGELGGDAFLFVDGSGMAGFDLESVNQAFLNGPVAATIPGAQGGIYRVSIVASDALQLVTAANLPFILDELVAVLTGPAISEQTVIVPDEEAEAVDG